jgi:hypothetical protein
MLKRLRTWVINGRLIEMGPPWQFVEAVALGARLASADKAIVVMSWQPRFERPNDAPIVADVELVDLDDLVSLAAGGRVFAAARVPSS